MRLSLVVLPLALIACSSSSSDPEPTADGDSATVADGESDSTTPTADALPDAVDDTLTDGADSTTSDSALDAADSADAGDGSAAETGGTDPGCGGITATATDVYVDVAATAPGKGGKTCPFTKIADALAAPLGGSTSRTIWVASGTYLESGIVVPDRVTVRGAGMAATIIKSASVDCEGMYNKCVVKVLGGSTLQDLGIDGTVPGGVCGAAIYTAKDGLVTLRAVDTLPTTCSGYIKVQTDALMVNVHTTMIIGAGLGKLTLRSEAPGQTIVDGGGIDMTEYATLDADGILVRNSGGFGIHLRTDTTASIGPRKHVVKNSEVTNNCTTPGSGNGAIEVLGTASLKLRNTKVLKNGCYGVRIIDASGYGGSVIDLGTDGDPGGNIFGSKIASERNTCGGVWLANTGGSATFPGQGNTWSTCPPPQNPISMLCGPYSDILYTGPAFNPVDTTGCK